MISCRYGAAILLFWYQSSAMASADRDCRRIVSNVERLACFDEAAGTPSHQTQRHWSAPEQNAPSVSRVMASEAGREPDDLTFRMADQSAGVSGLVISAPAIASFREPAYLAISCIQSISRLQLITHKPMETNWVAMRLAGEGWSSKETQWQVTENGQVLDAGRGLPAIEQIRTLIGAHRIELLSSNPAINGLTFDAQGLDPLIKQARSACRW